MLFQLFENIFSSYILVLWIISYILLLLVCYRDIENFKNLWIFSLLLWLVILFPLARRVYLALNDSRFMLPNFWVSCCIITFLLLLSIIFFLQILQKNVVKEESKFKKIFNNFSMLRLKSLKAIIYIEFMEYFIVYTLTYATIYVKNKFRKIILFVIMLFLPRIIVFFCLLYDLHLEKELYWSLKFSFLLFIPLIFNILLDMYYIYSKETFDKICDYFDLVQVPLSVEDEEKFNVSSKNHSKVDFYLKPSYRHEFNQERYDFVIRNFYEYGVFENWCKDTTNLRNLLLLYLNLILVNFELIIQIKLICNV